MKIRKFFSRLEKRKEGWYMNPAPTAAAEFPSDEAVAKIRELHTRVDTLKAAVATAERALSLTIKNREMIELSGDKKYEDAVRDRRADLDITKRKLAQSKIDLNTALLAERGRCETLRSRVWLCSYAEIIQPAAEKMAAARELLESAARDIVDALKPGSDAMLRLEKLDAATESWNSFAHELSGPGNERL
jgi:hypothetical protein